MCQLGFLRPVYRCLEALLTCMSVCVCRPVWVNLKMLGDRGNVCVCDVMWNSGGGFLEAVQQYQAAERPREKQQLSLFQGLPALPLPPPFSFSHHNYSSSFLTRSMFSSLSRIHPMFKGMWQCIHYIWAKDDNYVRNISFYCQTPFKGMWQAKFRNVSKMLPRLEC